MNKTVLQFARPASLLAAFIFLFVSCKKDDTQPEPQPEFRHEILLSPFPDILQSQTAKYGQLLVLTPAGDTIWKKELNTAAHNFQRWIINRQVRYSYAEFNQDAHDELPASLAGYEVILDKDFNEINRIKLLPYGSRTDETFIDAHDFILIDDNHYISMAYYPQKVTNIPDYLSPNPECRVVACIIQEVKDNQVVWEWNSTHYPQLYEASVESNDYSNDQLPQDYLHLNSIYIDPNDNNLVCSFRNADIIVKLNRQNGKVMWTLGGQSGDFPLASDQLFHRQHNATITDNGETLLVFDNGHATIRPYSRILEYKLDETAKKVTGFKSYIVPEFCKYMGSVQKTDSTYFIGGGSTPKMWEVDLKTRQVKWSRDLSSNSYRAFKY